MEHTTVRAADYIKKGSGLTKEQKRQSAVDAGETFRNQNEPPNLI